MNALLDYIREFPFFVLCIAGIVLDFCIDQVLEHIDFVHRRKHGAQLPAEIAAVPAAAAIDTQRLAKISEYEDAKYKAWLPKSVLHLMLTLALLLCNFYPWLFYAICRFTGRPDGFVTMFTSGFCFLILAGLPGELLSLPFSLYREFRLEKRFGFSNMTFRLWLADRAKSLLLSFLLSAVLVAAICAVLSRIAWWFVPVTVLLVAFTLLMMVVFPLFIAPLFNKFTPLEDGELKEKIIALMEGSGFKANGIFVVDGSKRSGHSNAYFTGLGKAKRIVLYDTLIGQLTTDELVAVLGHELGHCKLHHITKKLFAVIPLELALMFVLNLIALFPAIYRSFGFYTVDCADDTVFMQFIGLILANIALGAWGAVFTPVSNWFSRRDEYAADAFSARLTGMPDALSSALVKLSSENLSELLPPKIYAAWNYSHPTLAERIAALGADRPRSCKL